MRVPLVYALESVKIINVSDSTELGLQFPFVVALRACDVAMMDMVLTVVYCLARRKSAHQPKRHGTEENCCCM